MLFLNIGWMARYQGLAGQPDKIVNGGKWVTESGTGHEICNFLPATDGYIYGHVESSRGKNVDRQINFERLGIGSGEIVSPIHIVWTATSPSRGRYVVGWYKNATLYRRRKQHKKPQSPQHRRDQIADYRTKVISENAFLLPIESRTLQMPKKKGWMGQTPWWAPPQKIIDPEMIKFFDDLRQLMNGDEALATNGSTHRRGGGINGGAAQSPYTRYIEAYEIKITPQHHELQRKFADFIHQSWPLDIDENFQNVDLKFRHAEKGDILCEIKPCQSDNARFAIRTAMGQLLDYRQRTACDQLLIVVGECPTPEDKSLALDNGFSLAYPDKSTFEIEWARTALPQ